MRKVAAGMSSRVNAADAEEDAKAGFVDDSLIAEDTTKPHDKFILSTAGKRLNYNEVEDIIADMKSILTWLDFSCYRRGCVPLRRATRCRLL
jgi:hypothetical protein